MDIDVKNLHPLEVRLLRAVKMGEDITSDRIIKELDYKVGQCNQAFSWLSAKGLISEKSREKYAYYELTETGKSQEQNIKIKKSKTDFQKTYELIKRSRNYYTIDEIESTIFQQFNNDTKKLWNKNLWTHGDVTEVITQLMENGLVECDKFLWKGRLRAKKILNQVQDNLFS